jgi:hypothetical protein
MHNQNQDITSCEKTISRKEFLDKLVKGAALTGGLVAAPKILDKFVVQSVAAASGNCTIGTPAGNTDTSTNSNPGQCDDTLSGSTVLTSLSPFAVNGDTVMCVGDTTGSACINS